MTEPQIEPVSFMNTQGGDDLIVSFAIPLAEPGEVASLILMRSPKFEPFLPAEDHGVAVTHELRPDTKLEPDLLLYISVRKTDVEIQTTGEDYLLDISRVAEDEVTEACHVLRRMNFDGRFGMQIRRDA